jgi:DNA-binding response OmpR family regulator
MGKILVADDDIKSCELLEDLFKMKGHDVIMAYRPINYALLETEILSRYIK